jgi:hypothetical protein
MERKIRVGIAVLRVWVGSGGRDPDASLVDRSGCDKTAAFCRIAV